MAVVYRYVDLHDEVIKYVGIVWSNNRTLTQRSKEHYEKDEWCKDGCWRVEYLQKEIKSRIDAELLEAHYISKFKTNEWYNISKANWGTSELLENNENEEWKVFDTFGEIKPSNMITRFEGGFVSMGFDSDNELKLFIRSKDMKNGFDRLINYDFSLLENQNICIKSDNLLYAILNEFGICDTYSNLNNVFKELARGKIFEFSIIVEYEESEIDGKIIRIKIGKIEEFNGKISFNSIKHVLNVFEDYYINPIHEKESCNDFSLKDLEDAFGISIENSTKYESAEY